MKALGLIALVVVFALASVLMSGWVISMLWGWFVVPTFELPALTLSQAVGLGILVGFATRTLPDNEEKERSPDEMAAKMFGRFVSVSLAYPLICLLIALPFRP